MAKLKEYFRKNRSEVTLDQKYMRKWRKPPTEISLDASNEGDAEGVLTTLGEILSDDAAEDESGELVKARAFAALNQLTGRERALFEERHLQDERQPFTSLKSKFPLSSERLRQINANALGKVQAAFRPAWPPTCAGRPLSIVGHDAWLFLDEYKWCLQKGIGYLRRRCDGHRLGPEPTPKCDWHPRRYPVLHFSKTQIEEFLSTRPDLPQIPAPRPSNVIPFRRWQEPSSPTLIELGACA
jgi:hypothetical protein